MRTTHRSWFILFLVAQLPFIAISQTTPGGAQLSPAKLEIGTTVERELKGAETHQYSIYIEAGQFAALVVDQRGVDVVVRLKAPDGAMHSEIDSPNGAKGPEPISLIAKSSGVYLIEVASLEAKAPAGRYEIKLEAVRTATDQDKTGVLAAFLIDTKSETDRAARLVADKDFVTPQLAEELIKVGAAHLRVNDVERAMIAFTQARTIAEQTQAKGEVAVALQYIGNVHMTGSKLDLALESFKTSLQFAEQANDKLKIADSLERLGQVYRRQGKYDAAIESFRKSLQLATAAGNKKLMGGIYVSMGHVFLARGDFSSAIDEYNRSLAISEETANKLGIAWAHNNIGIGYNRQGLYAQSLEHYNKAIPIFQELKDKRGIAVVTSNIGITYANQGNEEGELESDLKVLSLFEELGDPSLIGRALNNVASTYRHREDFAKAMEYYQKSLAIRNALNDKDGEAIVLNGIGLVLYVQKQYDRALETFEKSIKIRSEFEDNERLAETLNNIARVYDAKGDNQRALDFASRSAALSAKYNYREMHWFSLAGVGRAYAKLNMLDEARKTLDASIQIVDSIRIDVAGPHSKAFFFSGAQLPFDLYIDLLMQMHKKQPTAGYVEQAMLFSERIRARSLLESISEAGTDIRRGVSDDLLTRERKLYEQLNQLAFRQSRLQEKDEKERGEISLEIAELTREHQAALNQIRRQSPAYSTLTQRESIDLKTIQNEVLDDETVMIQFFVGKDRGYGWVVTKQTLDSFELPPHGVIEPAVKKVYGLLSNGKSSGEETELRTAMSSLSKMLLGPASERLKKKRVLILADGPLQYLPFGALYDPNGSDGSAVPLSLRNEVVNLPSVSAQVFLARNRTARPRASKAIAVFADPVFDQSDGRVVELTAAKAAPISGGVNVDNSRVKRSVAEVGAIREGTVQRLPFTRREADGILMIAPKSGVLKAVNFQASRETALSSQMADYRIVHFATHGILHSGHPELSGIVLSLVNEKGEDVNGFLRLNDIYNMNLNADLVVLSACQTALGKEVRGEGLIGLTRGFMYAGSPRVVASLWKVDDVATAELMKIFYQKMLKENMRPAAALREAKIAMMKQKRWSSPYYWAAFELHGDWR